MERLTTNEEYIESKTEYERHLAQGYPRNISKERFLKLCEYEIVEEQGLLLRLPCKVGDTVYLVQGGKAYERKCNAFTVRENNKVYICMHDCEFDNCTFSVDLFEKEDVLGNALFLTKEEAEQKLTEMGGA